MVKSEPGNLSARSLSDLKLPRRSFEQACDEVIAYLMAHSPMGMWAVTRINGSQNTQTMLAVQSREYGVQAGAEFPFHTSVCKVMSSGQAPPVIPDAASEPAYCHALAASAKLGMIIGSYAGTPILSPSGRLFGALCGFSSERQPESLRSLQPLLELLGGLLASAMESDLRAHDADQAIENAEQAAETDSLTGLLNRRGWQRALDEEATSLLNFGGSAHVLIVDLDRLKDVNDTFGHAAGDGHIKMAAEVLHRTTRGWDRLARTGGDEFAMLVLGTDPAQVARIQRRIESEFDAAGVSASIGYAPFTVEGGFDGAWLLADEAMYEHKRSRRQETSGESQIPVMVGVVRGLDAAASITSLTA